MSDREFHAPGEPFVIPATVQIVDPASGGIFQLQRDEHINLDRAVALGVPGAAAWAAALDTVAYALECERNGAPLPSVTFPTLTATVDGKGTGRIPGVNVARGFNVSSANANFIIQLPKAVIGRLCHFVASATGYKLQTDRPYAVGINGGKGTGAKATVSANVAIDCTCSTQENWVCIDWTTDPNGVAISPAS